MNKKGAELTLSTLIIIVLGIAVLVFLIWGFGTGWNNLWSKITAYSGGGSNLDSTIQACQLACDGKQRVDFCEYQRTVKFGNKIETLNATGGVVNQTSTMGTCLNFSQNSNYKVNVEPCPGLDCSA